MNATAVYVKGFEDFQHLFHLILAEDTLGPPDDVQILFQDDQPFDDLFDQRRVAEFPREQPKVGLLKFEPESLALKVLDPALPQEPIPVLADPKPDCLLAQVPPGFLALNPLESMRFLLTTSLQA
jgi:hypothetical protein